MKKTIKTAAIMLAVTVFLLALAGCKAPFGLDRLFSGGTPVNSADDSEITSVIETPEVDVKQPDWSGIYKEFVLFDKYLSREYPYLSTYEYEYEAPDVNHFYFSLYDMSGDGVPELFLADDYLSEASYQVQVFTLIDGQIKYLGPISERHAWPCYDPSGRYDGVFTYSGHMGEYPCTYYSSDGTSLRSELVYIVYLDDTVGYADPGYTYRESEYMSAFESNGHYYPSTTDMELYKCARATASLGQYTLNDIQSLGWDGFVKKCVG